MTESRGQRTEGRRKSFCVFLFRFCLLPSAFCIPLFAQEPAASPYAPNRPIPLGDTLFNLPTSHIPGEGTWEVKFTHRFNQSIDQGSFHDRIHTLFGLDSNADVGVGLSWVAYRDLQLSFVRSNVLDDIELAAKYIVVQQARAIPVSIAARAGGDVRTEARLDDRSSVFGQLIVSHQFGRRAEVFAMPTFVTNAGRATTGDTSTALFRHAFNVPIGGAVMFGPAFSIVAEIVPVNRDLPNGVDAQLGWAAGIKRAIGGHYFELLLTNNNATHVDQYVTSTYQGAPLRRSDLHIGFNIERRFGGRASR